MKGGPAEASVVSSALMGSINGSAVANVVTTGTFTIPLMKKVGYRPEFAGAVEAVASTGGQLLPPVMGAAAFVMADLTGIPYSTIIIAAIVPGILYYLSLGVSVYLEADKQGLQAESADKLPQVKKGTQGGLVLCPAHHRVNRGPCWASAFPPTSLRCSASQCY